MNGAPDFEIGAIHLHGPLSSVYVGWRLLSISIVIPAYNEEARLPASLDQVIDYLRARDFQFAEILVVDDGSSDGTARLVEQRMATYSRIAAGEESWKSRQGIYCAPRCNGSARRMGPDHRCRSVRAHS